MLIQMFQREGKVLELAARKASLIFFLYICRFTAARKLPTLTQPPEKGPFSREKLSAAAISHFVEFVLQNFTKVRFLLIYLVNLKKHYFNTMLIFYQGYRLRHQGHQIGQRIH